MDQQQSNNVGSSNNGDEEDDNRPFDKYWNTQLPSSIKPKQSISSSQLNTTLNRSSNSGGGSNRSDLLNSPMAARLLSPSTRNAISNISMTGNKSGSEATRVGTNSSYLISNKSRISSDENFENYVHDTFGTKSNIGMCQNSSLN